MSPTPLTPTAKLQEKAGRGIQQAALKPGYGHLRTHTHHQGAGRLQATYIHIAISLLLYRQASVKTLENTTEDQIKMLHFLHLYLQSSKVDPGDESASRLRSSSLSRVT